MNEIKVQLDKWRGYSAYEVAKNNGFNGTEKEWLESLGAATNITVNERQVDDTGNITLSAEHIPLVENGQKTVAEELKEKFDAGDLVQDAATGGTETPLSAEAGKMILAEAKAKTTTIMQRVTIPAAGWEQDGDIYGQSVAVEGITADEDKTGAVVTPTPIREMMEEWNFCEVQASAQGDGVIVFTATDLPEQDLTANILIVDSGVSA